MDTLIDYVNALFTVFLILIFVRILLSWIRVSPVRRVPAAMYRFVHESTDWYLNFFRRFIPPVGMFDLSPIVALIVLYILNRLVVELLGAF